MSETIKKQEDSPSAQLSEPFALHGNRMIVVHDDYRVRRECVSRCLLLLPEYAASLMAAGHKDEADRFTYLAYDMSVFWQEEDGPRFGIKTPGAFFSSLKAAVSDAENAGQSRNLDSQELETIREGFQAHIAQMCDDAASLCLHLNTQYTELFRQMPRELDGTAVGPLLTAHKKVSRCLQLIPSHAASLSAAGRETEADRWKCLAYNMAVFWQGRIEETPDKFLNRFEKTVREAKTKGQHLKLSIQEQRSIRTGIQLHIAYILGDQDVASKRLCERYSELIDIMWSLQKQGEQTVGENPAVTKEQALQEKLSRIKQGFELMCSYAIQCAASGQDNMVINDIRRYSLGYAHYYGLANRFPEYKNNIDQYLNRLINAAKFIGCASQPSRDAMSTIVSRFREYEHDMRLDPGKITMQDAWASDVGRYANELERQFSLETRESSPAVQSQKAEHRRKKRQPER